MSTLQSIEAQVEAAPRDVEQARITYTRTQNLSRAACLTARTGRRAQGAEAAQAKLDALKRQWSAARDRGAGAIQRRADRGPPQPGADQRAHCSSGVAAEREADVRLRYTEIHAPIDGIVDVRAARVGEVVNRGSRSSR